MANAGVRAYIEGLGQSPQWDPGAEPLVECQGVKCPTEAESSVAFEAPAEEPNLTLVTDSFLVSRWCFGGAKFATWGA